MNQKNSRQKQRARIYAQLTIPEPLASQLHSKTRLSASQPTMFSCFFIHCTRQLPMPSCAVLSPARQTCPSLSQRDIPAFSLARRARLSTSYTSVILCQAVLPAAEPPRPSRCLGHVNQPAMAAFSHQGQGYSQPARLASQLAAHSRPIAIKLELPALQPAGQTCCMPPRQTCLPSRQLGHTDTHPRQPACLSASLPSVDFGHGLNSHASNARLQNPNRHGNQP